MFMRLIWWAAILAGVSYMAAVLDQMHGPAIIIWKGLGVGLLALWAAMMANQRDGWLIALVLALGALGDVLLDAKGLEMGALAFAAGHFVAIYLYARNARQQRSLSQNLLALALVPGALIICVAMLYPAAGWWHAALYSAIVAAMAACAWISRFPRYRTGLGAIAFLISDLLIFARAGGHIAPVLASALIWPLYFGGQALIAHGVVTSLRTAR